MTDQANPTPLDCTWPACPPRLHACRTIGDIARTIREVGGGDGTESISEGIRRLAARVKEQDAVLDRVRSIANDMNDLTHAHTWAGRIRDTIDGTTLTPAAPQNADRYQRMRRQRDLWQEWCRRQVSRRRADQNAVERVRQYIGVLREFARDTASADDRKLYESIAADLKRRLATLEPAPTATEATSGSGPGARWRVRAYGGGVCHDVGSVVPDHGDSPYATAIPVEGSEFDELVVGSFLHVEQVDDYVWWLNVGGVTVHVTVRDDGTPEYVWVAGPEDYDSPREGCGYELTWRPYVDKKEAI